MSELDLGLKVAARRLLWRMGYTTRIDVQLRSVGGVAIANTSNSRRSAAAESFTDLDVLGLTISGGYRVESAIVDCKTTAKGSTGRMFWVRGVADFFAADAAYMLRETDVTQAAKQLANRLHITALNSKELAQVEALHPSEFPLDSEPVAWLFDRDKTAKVLHAFSDLDGRLRELRDYREFDYWVGEEYRSLTQIVEQLRLANKLLSPRNPRHVSLVIDFAWLYTLSLTHAIENIRKAYISDVDLGLSQYILGGPIGFAEKKDLSAMLKHLRQEGAIPQEVYVDPLPTYYPRLLELTARLHRRPAHLISAMRLLEVGAFSTALKEKISAPTDTGALYDELAAKLAADVVEFLVTTSDLDSGFTARARSILLGEEFIDPESVKSS
ncbi:MULTISPECIES: hypothetical protein [Rhodococcus]|uniref:hypothetical protein n=1 Tax=Rhodococcus TaxID=1827 RepID=UPI0009F54835|nr:MULTISPECIES: hypothetical protein [Rhodococcus]ORC19966.1 hypothetical protein BXO91_22980 [Rhodococcus qingshengii]